MVHELPPGDAEERNGVVVVALVTVDAGRHPAGIGEGATGDSAHSRRPQTVAVRRGDQSAVDMCLYRSKSYFVYLSVSKYISV